MDLGDLAVAHLRRARRRLEWQDVVVEMDAAVVDRLRGFARQVLIAVALGQVGDRRRLRRGPLLQGDVLAPIDPLAQLLGLLAGRRDRPIWIAADGIPAHDPVGDVVETERPHSAGMPISRRKYPAGKAFDLGVVDQRGALLRRRFALNDFLGEFLWDGILLVCVSSLSSSAETCTILP